MRAAAHVPELMKIDIKVTGIREMRFRIWFGGILIRLAAWVMGGVGTIEVTTPEGDGMTQVTRFELENVGYDEPDFRLVESKDGEWVRYADHVAAVLAEREACAVAADPPGTVYDESSEWGRAWKAANNRAAYRVRERVILDKP